MQKKAVLKELAIRELEDRHKEQRKSLVSFIEFFFKNELNKEFQANWHYKVIEEKLKEVLEGKCNRLIINIPPGSGKTELITKCFPVWALGHKPDMRFIVTGYSSTLTQDFGSQARDYYRSETFRSVFPRRANIREDQDTKAEWTNDKGGVYFATGAGGAITGRRANVFIIDDPIKPDEALSDVKRTAINRWYENTVVSRLFNPLQDAVIIIMQRTHEDDLCGMLMEKMKDGTGEHWDTIVLPAIATERDDYRDYGEALQKERYPIEALELINKSYGEANFSTQYQQEPVNKEAQEFHEEFFQYYDQPPVGCYEIFTVVDPAFSQKQDADYSCIITGVFDKDKLDVLEISNIKVDAYKLIEKIVYHCRKWGTQKIGIEAIQAQTVLAQMLKKTLVENRLYLSIHEIKQRGEKEMKIRKLVPLIRNGLIFWKKEMTELELQLIKFPRGKHDDIIDALQMFYELKVIQPVGQSMQYKPATRFNADGLPIYN